MGGVVMYICGMILRCVSRCVITWNPGMSLDQLQQIWQQLSCIVINCW